MPIELRSIVQQVLAFPGQFKRFAIATVLDLGQGIVAVQKLQVLDPIP
ncbi:hypothetical protein QUA81_17035 [Microcoleus sp. F6_B4]